MTPVYTEEETRVLRARVKRKILITSILAAIWFGSILVIYFRTTTATFFEMRKLTRQIMLYGGLVLLLIVHGIVLPDYWALKLRKILDREPKDVSIGRYKFVEEKIPIRKEIIVDVMELETRNKVENLMIDHDKAEEFKKCGRLVRVQSARSYITAYEELDTWKNSYED